MVAAMPGARHLYVHVPFCAHRCGYCDFVTVTGHDARHAPYVDALTAEVALARDRGELADDVGTVYLGGGTPSLIGPALLARLLDALPRPAEELTVECNPETIDARLAEVLAVRGARVSLGVQSLDPGRLTLLERRATPGRVVEAVEALRLAGVESLSLDLIFGVPGESVEQAADDAAALAALGPDHVSAYELEAKPGTRFTRAHGGRLATEQDALEGHYEAVVTTLEAAGFDWYETASFGLAGHRGIHNRAYWQARDYLGVGIGAVSTIGTERRTNAPRLTAYIEALQAGRSAPAAREEITSRTRRVERLLLGLRLAEGVPLDEVAEVVDQAGLTRMRRLELIETEPADTIRLTRRGRFLLSSVAAELIADAPSSTD